MPETSTVTGLGASEFLRRHWQKQPLIARGAMPECETLVRRDALFELATRDDVESRLVQRHGQRWQVRHGPFERAALARLPRSGWTLLVQGVNHVLPAVQPLLDAFSFIPYARLDDLMASYAPPGGGVGPHFDDYDVFLVQGKGRRRWRVSRQRDLELVAGAPLKILRRFRPSAEWVLQPGDLLYLPPRCAHDGVAVSGDCITYSVGFRAPRAQELASRFLDYLQEHLRLSGIYRDPGLRRARRPALLDDRLLRGAQEFVGRIRWSAGDVERFLGCHLTEPKAHVLFHRPRHPLPPRAFAAQVMRAGVRLAPATRMLFRGRTLFINGECSGVAAATARLLSRLADRRSLPPCPGLDRQSGDLLHQWYRAGYVLPGTGDRR